MALLDQFSIYDKEVNTKLVGGHSDDSNNRYESLSVLKDKIDIMYKYRNNQIKDIDNTGTKDNSPGVIENICNAHSFKSFDEFSEAAAATSLIFKDKSNLYLDASSGRFYLTLERVTTSNMDYNKTCNILSEYGTKETLNSSSVCYFREHYRCIIKDRAIQVASKL